MSADTSRSSVEKKTRVPSAEAPLKIASKAPLTLFTAAEIRVVTPLKRW